MNLADDARTLPQLARVGILSTADREVLRRLSGDLTLAEWMEWPAERREAMPWKPDTRLRLVMGARVQAVQQARLMARVAPAAFIRAVR